MTDVRALPPTFTVSFTDDERLAASVRRLLRDDYEVAAVMRSTLSSDWPGDLAGRLLLSLSRYARAGAPTAVRAAELNESLLVALEPRGYLGVPFSDIVDEQQVACHGWVAAGLLQYFHFSGDVRSRRAAHRVIDALLIPAWKRGDYPWGRDVGPDIGDPSGTATEVIDGWSLSSDVWCVLLTLNAFVPAARESGRADLASIISSMTDVVAGLDVVAHRAQLHAVMAAARNLADWATATGDRRAADVAEGLYATYERHGRTLNHATFNWFGRPESWTEPCAIVDTIGAASSLYAITGRDRYRTDTARIAHNGLAFAERLDGSFGLDTIATAQDPVLAPVEGDAHWCCTIRGAIGLLEDRETAAAFVDGVLVITDLYPGSHVVPTSAGTWRVRQTTDFPSTTAVSFEVLEAPTSTTALPVSIRLEAQPVTVSLPPTVGATVTVTVPVTESRERIEGGDLRRWGPILLVVDEDDASRRPRPLSEITGTFAGADGPRLRLSLHTEPRGGASPMMTGDDAGRSKEST